ncbi:GtrA family protein [Selenomonas sp.]|uniref:GtrA family protein n=1 Tax=Selenomonas sp. TaxID=2053611 RepID=UPI0025F3B0D3|nr:GtrA family protein [Selenomonas sp.]MCI6283348.1 GtrA family protein [Selenomonas sp.]
MKLPRGRESLIQLVKFGIVGCSNTLIGFGAYYALVWLGVHYMIANVVSWLVSVFNAFYWNNKYVFQNQTPWLRALLKTYASYGFSFLVGTALLWALVELVHVSEYLAPLLVLVVTIPLNFVMNKFWTFK